MKSFGNRLLCLHRPEFSINFGNADAVDTRREDFKTRGNERISIVFVSLFQSGTVLFFEDVAMKRWWKVCLVKRLNSVELQFFFFIYVEITTRTGRKRKRIKRD